MKKVLLLLAIFLPQMASAHAFGILYNLPVPFWLYLYGGAAAIVVSFLLIGYFFNKKQDNLTYRTYQVSTLSRWLIILLQAGSLLLFVLTIVSGYIGENSSFVNFNMTFFWIIFALGLTYFTALFGDIYYYINPWKILMSWWKAPGLFKYPQAAGYYPALGFYFLFIWFELIGNTFPMRLSVILILYTAINVLGVMGIGRENWFRYGEFFSVFFRLIGKVAPIEYREGAVHLRAPFVGLLKEKADHFSLIVFILFMLSSTAFDGFSETLPWVRFYWVELGGMFSFKIFDTIGLILSIFVFLIIYLDLIALVKVITKSPRSVVDLALEFAFTLVPIVLVYNLAHYFTLIFTEGPNIIRLISDPFGFGWNLFGTADAFIKIIPSANIVWHSQVAFILLGHIVAVYLAHLVSLRIFPNRRSAMLSQVPMLILMVFYTMIGLWILSQPITGGTL